MAVIFSRRFFQAGTLAALLFIIISACGSSSAYADNGGVLWKQRGAEIASHEPPKEPSLVPVVISAMAGSVLGIEVAVVGIGVATGTTTSWWVLGTGGAVIGAVGGYLAGDYFFNPKPETKSKPELKAAPTQLQTAQKDKPLR